MSEIVIQGTTPGIRVSGTGAQVTVKVTTGSGGGGGGVTDHNALTGRSDPDQHPIGAVTGLQGALDGKVSTSDQRLSDARTPTAHKSTHGTGGTDEIAPADIGARPAGNVDWSEIDNKPSIPAAQVNSDWTASSGVAQILHKPTIPSAPADIGAAEETHVHGAADITSGVIDPARLPALPVSLVVAVGDETTALTTTNNPKVSFRMPHAMTLTSIRASLRTSSSSGNPTFDVKLNGASILSTLVTVDVSAKTSVGAAVPAVISTLALPDDGEITIDITGAGTGAAGAKITLVGTRGY